MRECPFHKERLDHIARFARMCYRRNLSERGDRIDYSAEQLVWEILRASCKEPTMTEEHARVIMQFAEQEVCERSQHARTVFRVAARFIVRKYDSENYERIRPRRQHV